MAENSYLYLKLNGADIQGESTVSSNGRENSIECFYFHMEVNTARDAGSGMATGRRQYQPLLIRKQIDKSTPLIAKGLVENQVTEGILKFFRPSPSGDGTTEQYYTIGFKGGRVATIKQISEDSVGPSGSTRKELEEISFTFETISWTFTQGGVTHEDSWRDSR